VKYTSIRESMQQDVENHMLRGLMYSVMGMYQHACGSNLKANRKLKKLHEYQSLVAFWGFPKR
jgi:hypothetical protein